MAQDYIEPQRTGPRLEPLGIRRQKVDLAGLSLSSLSRYNQGCSG